MTIKYKCTYDLPLPRFNGMSRSQHDILESVEHIAKSLRDRKVVLFVAAGCSADSQIPLAGELAARLALNYYHTEERIVQKFGYSKPRLDEVAQMISNDMGKLPIIDELQFDTWRDKKPNEAHRVIGELAREGMLQHVVTVNYDELIENGCRLVDHEPVVVRSDHDLGLVKDGRLTIYKINGCVTRAPDILITTEDLQKNYDGWVREQMSVMLKKYGMTFIGMSNPSPILLDMFKDVFEEIPEVRHKPFWVNPNESPGPEAEKLLAVCKATQNYIPMSAPHFLRQLQISAIGIVINEIFRNVVNDQVKKICQPPNEAALSELITSMQRVQSFFLSRNISQLSETLKLSRIEFGDQYMYMQFEGYEKKIARLFLWITMVHWALERIYQSPQLVNLDTAGVHASLTDSMGRRKSFLFVDSMDDLIGSKQILNGYLDMLGSPRTSFIGPDLEFLKRPHKLVIVRMGAGDSNDEFQIRTPGEVYRPMVIGDTSMLDELPSSGPEFLVSRLKNLLKD
jgi:hypothetical protein